MSSDAITLRPSSSSSISVSTSSPTSVARERDSISPKAFFSTFRPYEILYKGKISVEKLGDDRDLQLLCLEDRLSIQFKKHSFKITLKEKGSYQIAGDHQNCTIVIICPNKRFKRILPKAQ
ncbi:MAG TPA: hypothetical protein VGJ00_10060 [Rhabdochlamydiaceae bacterium]|jgi:hypothetical protein